MTIAGPKLDIQNLRILPLPSPSAFDGFRSGEPEIDRRLGACCEWHDCHRAKVFCAYLETQLYGFYCLSQHAHDSTEIGSLFARASDDVRSYVPLIYLNYLAVREGYRRQKIGTILLMNAIVRCALVMRNIGSYAVALKALSDDAVEFYGHFRFKPTNDQQKYPFMIMPARTVLELIPEAMP